MRDRFHDLLPLHVEGDLPPSEAAQVRRHLADCAACREEEAALRESQAFWKEAPEPDLGEAFHADVRRAVRVRIAEEAERTRRRSRFLLWSGLATAAAAAVLVAAFLVLEEPRLLAPPAVAVARVTPVPSPAAAAASVAVAEAPSRPKSPHSPHPPHRPALVRHALRPAGASRVTRIEMATANPNVRIIWLAKASDAAPI